MDVILKISGKEALEMMIELIKDIWRKALIREHASNMWQGACDLSPCMRSASASPSFHEIGLATLAFLLTGRITDRSTLGLLVADL